MLGQLRPLLTRCVVVSFACATALPALAASARMGFAGPKIISAPRFAPRVAGRHDLREGRFAGHRGRGRGGAGFDYGDGAYAVPVPVPAGGGPSAEPPGGASPTEDYGSGYRAPSTFAPGPQIITLPDPPRGKAARAARFASAAGRRDAGVSGFTREPRYYAHRYRPRFAAGYGYGAGYGYLPSYAYQPSPVAFFTCCNTRYTPIYNSPCGVLRPYW